MLWPWGQKKAAPAPVESESELALEVSPVPAPALVSVEACKHPAFYVRGWHTVGMCQCSVCDAPLDMVVELDKAIQRLQAAIAAAEQVLAGGVIVQRRK